MNRFRCALKSGALLCRSALATFLLLLLFPALGQPSGDDSLGERLTRDYWAAVKAQDVEALERMLAPGFQSVHIDGVRDRGTELSLLAGFNLSDYTLSDFTVTREGAVLIVTYWASVEETLAGERTSPRPTLRLSVWLETEDGWQQIAHANLSEL